MAGSRLRSTEAKNYLSNITVGVNAGFCSRQGSTQSTISSRRATSSSVGCVGDRIGAHRKCGSLVLAVDPKCPDEESKSSEASTWRRFLE